jgi:hypothetical protein
MYTRLPPSRTSSPLAAKGRQRPGAGAIAPAARRRPLRPPPAAGGGSRSAGEGGRRGGGESGPQAVNKERCRHRPAPRGMREWVAGGLRGRGWRRGRRGRGWGSTWRWPRRGACGRRASTGSRPCRPPGTAARVCDGLDERKGVLTLVGGWKGMQWIWGLGCSGGAGAFSRSPFMALAVTATMGVRWFSPPRCRIFSVACARPPPRFTVRACVCWGGGGTSISEVSWMLVRGTCYAEVVVVVSYG